MGDYTEHLISMAGGYGDDASGMAELLAAHWRQGGIRNNRQECICGWGFGLVDDESPREKFAAHQANVLVAAGFGPVKEAGAAALEEAADEIDRLRVVGKTPYDQCTESDRSAWYDFAEVRPEGWLRARAAAVRDQS